MPTQEESKYCDRCKRYMLVRKPATNHILHLILSIVTVGFWIPIWILVGISVASTKWRCTHCGKTI